MFLPRLILNAWAPSFPLGLCGRELREMNTLPCGKDHGGF